MAITRTKSTKLSVSLTHASYINIKTRKQETGESLSSIIESALRDQKILSDEDRAMLISIRQDLSRVGANLNQIAHALNASEYVTRSHIETTAQEVKETVATIKQYL